MYKRLETVHCGEPKIVESSVLAVPRGHVLLKTSLALLGEVDRAIALCFASCLDAHALGVAAHGKVLDVGLGVESGLEGRNVVTKPFCEEAPLFRDGYAQEISVVDARCLEVVPPSVDPLDALMAMQLSSPREQLEELEAREVLVVGRDLSLLPYAVFCSERSSRCFAIPRETPVARNIGLEAASLTARKLFDVVVIATMDPMVIESVVRMCRDGGTIVVYPPILSTGLLRPRRSCRIVAMSFEGLREGLEALRRVRELAAKCVKVFRGLDVHAVFEAPAVLNLGSNEEKYSKRRRR